MIDISMDNSCQGLPSVTDRSGCGEDDNEDEDVRDEDEHFFDNGEECDSMETHAQQ